MAHFVRQHLFFAKFAYAGVFFAAVNSEILVDEMEANSDVIIRQIFSASFLAALRGIMGFKKSTFIFSIKLLTLENCVDKIILLIFFHIYQDYAKFVVHFQGFLR